MLLHILWKALSRLGEAQHLALVAAAARTELLPAVDVAEQTQPVPLLEATEQPHHLGRGRSSHAAGVGP